MSPRVQTQTIQECLRTPRIPFLLSRFDLVLKALTKRGSLFDQSFFVTVSQVAVPALTKRGSLFDQSFFVTESTNPRSLFRIVILKLEALKELFPQYYICFPTSV
jgi:hypothetical protein